MSAIKKQCADLQSMAEFITTTENSEPRICCVIGMFGGRKYKCTVDLEGKEKKLTFILNDLVKQYKRLCNQIDAPNGEKELNPDDKKYIILIGQHIRSLDRTGKNSLSHKNKFIKSLTCIRRVGHLFFNREKKLNQLFDKYFEEELQREFKAIKSLIQKMGSNLQKAYKLEYDNFVAKTQILREKIDAHEWSKEEEDLPKEVNDLEEELMDNQDELGFQENKKKYGRKLDILLNKIKEIDKFSLLESHSFEKNCDHFFSQLGDRKIRVFLFLLLEDEQPHNYYLIKKASLYFSKNEDQNKLEQLIDNYINVY